MDVELIYSTNDEDYRHYELNDAVNDLFSDTDEFKIGDISSIWVGEIKRPKAGDMTPDVAEYLNQYAYDNYGEVVDTWPDTTKDIESELQKSINSVVNEWADKHSIQPTFGNVENTKEIKVKVTGKMEGDFEVVK